MGVINRFLVGTDIWHKGYPMLKAVILLFLFFLLSCNNDKDIIKPVVSGITESVYASGVVKSQAQYQAFPIVSGTIASIFLKEGAQVKVGTPVLSITNELQVLNSQNAELSAQYASIKNNQSKLNDAKILIALQLQKMKNDSLLLKRQENVWKTGGGTKVELEQRTLNYASAKVAYQSAVLQYDELKKQLDFNAQQASKNLQISQKLKADYTLKSEIEGKVYKLYKKAGEAVTPQTPLALLGAENQFILELDVDEYDIFKVQLGQQVLVTMDSYKGQVFEAKVATISPMMDESSKTFLVEAVFVNPPKLLYPFISFEANIVIQQKSRALLIPVSYLVNDSTVLNNHGETVKVKTGLRDYKMVEILTGLSASDELSKPK